MLPQHTFWRGKRVLLTGHTGFKGAWLLLWLINLGAEVWCYGLEPESSPSLFTLLRHEYGSNAHDCKGDINDKHAISGLIEESSPDVVFHLAAQSLVRQSYVDPLGTWATNVMGSLTLLDALKRLDHKCAVVMVTTDKVYENKSWLYGYRENDSLGGHDPYSASKAGAEIAISSWRACFCGMESHQSPYLKIATARAGNVIGGGDWATDRIVPDAIRSLNAGTSIVVRNPDSTRPWQHVLEPLSGYLLLAEKLFTRENPPTEAFNFGPFTSSNLSVRELVDLILSHWPGSWLDFSNAKGVHEATMLNLQIDKAHHQLGWRPRWNYEETVSRTVVGWYKQYYKGTPALDCCINDYVAYTNCDPSFG